MSDYEQMLVSALRYALGRRTYIVDLTVEYILNELPELSEHCINVMIQDIKEQERFGYGDPCDESDWKVEE
ncbi:MAG: hypothetical protein ACI4LK_02415 [Lentihominibacter sp.]